MKISASNSLLCMFALSACFVGKLWATDFKFATVQVPGSTSTLPTGINKKGDVVGYYEKEGVFNGFLLRGGEYSSIHCPSADSGTFTIGINDQGLIVGYYGVSNQTYPFEYVSGKCELLPSFDGASLYPTAINNAGDVVGYADVGFNPVYGWELKGNKYTKIAIPNANETYVMGINTAGHISGMYSDKLGTHGFLRHNGRYQTINVPQSPSFTAGYGLNDNDAVVGSFADPKTQSYEGFVDTRNKFQQMIVPKSVETLPTAINDSNVVVGSYANSAGETQGFMAVPK